MGERVDIKRKIAEWREQLLDLTKRNRLISCKIGKTGPIELEHPDFATTWKRLVTNGDPMWFPRKAELLGLEPDEESLYTADDVDDSTQSRIVRGGPTELEACRQSPRLKPTHVLTSLTDKALGGKLGRLALAAKTSLSEQGVNTLFLAFGLLKWFESKDSEVELYAPLLLIPVRLRRDSADSEWMLAAVEEELVPNYCLAELLRTQFTINAPQPDEETLLEDPAAITKYFAAFKRAIAAHPRWDVQPRIVLGAFGFQKVAMWQDLQRNEQKIAGNDLCRAIGGEGDALSHSDGLSQPDSLDELSTPENTFHILDCDSSQHAAIEAIKGGSHLVLDGPPGTGKSQTIANAIAEALARGQTVLFVSEKAAALEVVKRRLDQAGLGDFCLECHSHKANKRDIVGKLGESLRLKPEHFPSQDEQLRQLLRLRNELNAYVKALHKRRLKLNESVYRVCGRLAAVSDAPVTRCVLPPPEWVDAAKLEELCRAVDAVAKLDSVLFTSASHPWRGCRAATWSMTLEDDVRFHFAAAAKEIARRHAAVAPLAGLGFIDPDPTLSQMADALQQAKQALTLPRIPPAWFAADTRKVIANYISLHNTANRFAALRATVPAYCTEAIAHHEETLIGSVNSTNDWIARVRPHPNSTVRTAAQHLALIAGEASSTATLAETLARILDRVLEMLRLNPASDQFDTPGDLLALKNVGRVTAAASIVGDLGRCHAGWFDSQRRQILTKAVKALGAELRFITEERRHLDRTFTSAAFEPGVDDLLSKVQRHDKCDYVARLQPHPSTTTQGTAQHYAAVANEIGSTAKLAKSLDGAIDRASALLQLKDSSEESASTGATTIEHAGRLSAAASIVAQLGTCHPSWFDSSRRQILKTSVQELADEDGRLRQERQQLEQIFSSSAITGDVDGVLADVQQHNSWLRRMFPSWRRARTAMLGLYRTPPESAASRALIAAARKLQSYRSQTAAFRAMMRPVAAELAVDGRDINWVRVADNLGRIEQLQAVLRLPTALISLLCVEEGIDRNGVAHAAQDLKSKQQALRVATTRLQEVFQADPDGKRYDTQTPRQFATFLQAAETTLRQRSEELKALSALARSDQELPLVFSATSTGTSPADPGHLKLHRARVQAFRQAIVPVAEEIRFDASEDFDWAKVANDLERIDRLQALITCPDTLVSLLSAPDGIDRNRVRHAALELKTAQQALNEAISHFQEIYDIDVKGADERFDTRAPTHLVEFLRAADIALRERCSGFESLIQLIKSDQDVDLDTVADDLNALGELRLLRETAVNLAVGIGLGDKPGPELAQDQWARHAAAASALRKAFEHASWPLPKHLVDVMSTPAIRQRVQELIASASFVAEPLDAIPSLKFAQQIIPFDRSVSIGVTPDKLRASELSRWLADRSADAPRLQEWLHLADATQRMKSFGLDVLFEEMRTRQVPSAHARQSLLQRFFRQWLDVACAEAGVLARFCSEDHEGTIAEFTDLDRRIIAHTYERVREAQLAEAGLRSGDHADAPAASERGILLRELAKKRRHLPLRQLFRQIATLLMKLKPCMMMSPLAVSTFLDSEQLQFDLIIFDEASQVRPHDAIGAIYRGKQLVVAGDQKQLPPTNFFERTGGVVDTADDAADDEKEVQQSTRDFESILDVCATLRIPHRQLLWHYRSRRESLIAFSNRHFYDDQLVTFPSTQDFDGSSGVRLEFVAEGRWQGGAGAGVNPVEAQRTAEVVIRHARENPAASLGVITMNQAQQLLVYDEIEKRKRAHPAIAEFFSENRDEPFFVKNLENVQGDERDVIILTVNYAKSAAGTLSHNFGPLNHAGGERRLNVAVTRAKHELIVVSSITSNDIDLSRTAAKGAALLRAYLDFAERGPSALEREVQEDPGKDHDSEFEAQVARALRTAGLDVRKQVGCGGFRIDLALVDPERPGRYVLGIECDGATYHSSATARDRDRLRQEVLERLGWTICRIWSTDWVRDPRRQIAKVVDAYARARTNPPAQKTAPLPTPEPPRRAPVANGNGKDSAIPPQQFNFSDIDDVPSDLVDQLLVEVLGQNGATPTDDLTRATARRLGFTRTGNRISERLEQRIRNLRRKAIINADDEGRLFRAIRPSPA